MSISITNRPNLVCWTYAPIKFNFSYSGVLATAKLQVQVITPAGMVLTEVQYPFNTSAGNISIDFAEIMDALVKFTVPIISTTNMLGLNGNQYRKVKLRYRQTYPGSTDPWTTDSTNYMIIKGGINNLATLLDEDQNRDTSNSTASSFLPGQFFPDATHRYLTYLPTKTIVTPGQTVWLLYYHHPGALVTLPTYNIGIHYTFKYFDGSTATVTKPAVISPIDICWWIPAGVQQSGVNTGGKAIEMYTVEIYDNDALGVIYSSYTFMVDNRPHYDTLDIYYRNSFGGLETLQLQGRIETTVASDRGEYRQRPAFNGTNPYYRSEIRLSWKANTGFVTEARALALAELVNAIDVYTIVNGQWVALRVKNKEALLRNSFSKLHNQEVELETAATYKALPKQLMQL